MQMGCSAPEDFSLLFSCSLCSLTLTHDRDSEGSTKIYISIPRGGRHSTVSEARMLVMVMVIRAQVSLRGALY